MAGISNNSESKKGNRRCLAIKDDGTICGTYLNSYHDDKICFACRHRFCWQLTTPKLATMQELQKQRGDNNGG